MFVHTSGFDLYSASLSSILFKLSFDFDDFHLPQKEHYEREMEKRLIRTNPLGKDRDHNRYWWFKGDGRIFVESSESKQWGYYSTKEEVLVLAA